MPSGHVLIIDDEKCLAELARDFFELEDFEVKIAENGESGLDHFINHDFDAIIVDLIMPKVNGTEFINLVQRSKKKTPLIYIMTGKMEEEEKIIKELDKPVDGIFIKPFDLEELLVIIRNAINKTKVAC